MADSTTPKGPPVSKDGKTVSTANPKLIQGYREAWRLEVAEANTYRALAARETDPEKRSILQRLAESEDRHADKWAVRLHELGAETGPYQESLGNRIRRWSWVQSGTDNAVRNLEATEDHADALYQELLDTGVEEYDRKLLLETQREEKAHGRLLGEMADATQPTAQRKLNKILSAEKWHVTAGGWIGQAIYGVNDGLGAAFGVVSGVAGATSVNGEFVLLSGLATMIASALSMGSGAYLATKSEGEVYQAELDRERKEIETDPDEEREEMALFYELKGFGREEAKKMADRLAEKPEQLLKSLAHEELGLSEQNFPNPWKSAVSASISTALGALIPVLPFFFLTGTTALATSFVISTLAHFAVGASKVIVTGRSWLKSGTEMTVIGVGEALVTFVIGTLISPVLH